MERTEAQISESQLTAFFVELLQRKPRPLEPPIENVEQGRCFFGAQATGFSERDQRVASGIEWSSPAMKRQPAPVRLELDLREAGSERVSVDGVPPGLVQGANRELRGDRDTALYLSIASRDL